MAGAFRGGDKTKAANKQKPANQANWQQSELWIPVVSVCESGSMWGHLGVSTAFCVCVSTAHTHFPLLKWLLIDKKQKNEEK